MSFEIESARYHERLPELLKEHEGKYVALFGDQVVSIGWIDPQTAKCLRQDEG